MDTRQEISESVDRWIKGLKLTDRPSDESIREAVNALYTANGYKAPLEVVICDSPWVARSLILAYGSSRGDRIRITWPNWRASNATAHVANMIPAPLQTMMQHIWNEDWHQFENASTTKQAAERIIETQTPTIFGRFRRKFSLKFEVPHIGTRVPASISGDLTSTLVGYEWSLKHDLHIPSPFREQMQSLVDYHKVGSYLFAFNQVAFVTLKPTEFHLNDLRQIDNRNGPAIKWNDGAELYYVSGFGIKKQYVLDKYSISWNEISRAINNNGRLAMVLIDLFGRDRAVSQWAGGHAYRDEYGTLYRHWNLNWQILRVKNGTPEPDGSIKDYYLFVPSHLRSGRDAVAWTYGMEGHDYERLVKRT